MSRGQRRLTIEDIARLAGVSQTAVSFVLNGKDGVGAATRDKVNEVIEATGYRPNASSRRLSFQKSFNIALVYPPSASPFSDLYYYEIARGLTEKLSEHDYNVVFSVLRPDGDAQTLPKVLLQQDADGAVLMQDQEPIILAKIDNLDIPYVLVDIHVPDRTHTHISVDSEQSIYTAVNYLIARGHTNIAFLGTDWLPSYYVQCLSGYQRAMGEHNLSIHPAWLQKNANNIQSTEACIETILSTQQRPTAICCMGDIHAIDAMSIVKTKGISIPQDISFISIDDIILSRYVDPPLTTISYDKQEMGYLAADLILKKIKGEKAESIIVKSDMVIERVSVRHMDSRPI